MKNNPFSALSKFYSVTLFLLFLVFISEPQPAQAQPLTGTDSSIKYLGIQESHAVFQLQIENETEESYTVRIKDHSGNLLFYKTFRDKRILQKFYFNKEEMGELVTFIITSRKKQKIETFQVDRNVRVIEEVVITKQ